MLVMEQFYANVTTDKIKIVELKSYPRYLHKFITKDKTETLLR